MFDRYDEVALFGTALGPLFTTDPTAEGMADAVAAFAALDVQAASDEWPFANGERAKAFLSLMHEGALSGVDDSLIWEYRRLFVGPGPMPVPPWGSVYTDRECVVFGQTTIELRSWMRSSGVARLGDEKTPEDHIGLMLLLASWLAEHKPDLLGDFLQNHLLTWSSHMLAQLEDAARHPFYRGLAGLTRETLEGLGDTMDLHPVQPRFYR